MVVEPEAIGGQAGTSSLIRNYLGFPSGVSGGDLAVRAYAQAWSFGAEYVYGNPATSLRPEGPELVVTVADGTEIRSGAVVVASGMAYRRLGIAELDALTGVGVFYGAAASEAKAVQGSEVFVVGGANSAGQAAVHLAKYAAQVTLLVRGRSLADSMSEYLIREIDAAPNIAVRCRVAVTGGAGQNRLESLTLTDLESGEAETVGAGALFVLIGAEPRTQWLPDTVRRDQSGFVVTGTDLLEDGLAARGLAAAAAADVPGIQPARRLRGRRRPVRVGETRGLGRRRGFHRHPPGPRLPAQHVTRRAGLEAPHRWNRRTPAARRRPVRAGCYRSSSRYGTSWRCSSTSSSGSSSGISAGVEGCPRSSASWSAYSSSAYSSSGLLSMLDVMAASFACRCPGRNRRS